MATKIYHGAPGSYKSSSAVWFEMLPALRAGRVVVTNLQGCCTLEEMQVELNEVFPSSARVLRISIATDNGMLLFRNFYQWLPIGAMIFIDEIQDVYPNDRSFKSSDYDYKGEGFFNDLLPDEFSIIYHDVQKLLIGNVNQDDYMDDLGDSLFDERGYLRYPRTLRECFMRHRHFNWDILLATPDIKEVNPFIRSVAEVAYSFASKDAIPLKYYKRRPRLIEHNPKGNGLTAGKADAVSFRKVPLEVHKLYKSTATGQTTKSGVANSPITIWVKIGGITILSYFVFLIYWYAYDGRGHSVVPIKTLPVEVSQNKVDKEENRAVVQKANEVVIKDIGKDFPFSFNNGLLTTGVKNDISLIGLPYSISSIYVSAVSTVYITDDFFTRKYIFKVTDTKGISYTVTSDFLSKFGYKVFYSTDCILEIRNKTSSNLVLCEPVQKHHFKSNSSTISLGSF